VKKKKTAGSKICKNDYYGSYYCEKLYQSEKRDPDYTGGEGGLGLGSLCLRFKNLLLGGPKGENNHAEAVSGAAEITLSRKEGKKMRHTSGGRNPCTGGEKGHRRKYSKKKKR